MKRDLFRLLFTATFINLQGCIANAEGFMIFAGIAFVLAVIIGLVAVFTKNSETSNRAAVFAFVMIVIFLLVTILA